MTEKELFDAADLIICPIFGSGVEDDCNDVLHKEVGMILRYEPAMQYIGTGEHIPCALADAEGDFVKYADHLAMTEGQREIMTDLEDKLEKAQAANAELEAQLKELILRNGQYAEALQSSQSQVSDDLLKHAKHYRDHYLLDEIDEPELCIDKVQHDAILAFSSAIDRALQSIPADTKGGE